MPKLLQNTLIIILTALMLTVLAYYYIDKPVVFWAAQHHLRHYGWLDNLTYLPKLMSASLLLIYPILVLRFSYDRWTKIDSTLATAATSLITSEFLCHLLKPIFGRYWPETWTDHNLSLLHDQAYGFNGWHTGPAYQSFPSGHATIITAVATVIWLSCSRHLRPFIVLVCLTVMSALIMLYYHFVSDVIAGSALGLLTGLYVTRVARN